MFFDMNDEIEKIINEQNGLDARLFELVSASMATENIEQQNAAILKAADYIRKKNSKSEGKSFMISPNVGNVNGHVESYNALPLDYCRRLCQTPIPRAIVSTRVEKIAHYCTPVYDENEDGFTVVKKKGFGVDKGDEKVRQELINFILNCGGDENKWDRNDFNTFLRGLVKDSMEIDNAAFEVRYEGSKPVEFFVVDGATIRFADTYFDKFKNKNRVQNGGYFPHYVQYIDGQETAEYYPWEMCLMIRNIQTDIDGYGYGIPEIQICSTLASAMVMCDRHNINAFTHGAMPKGLIHTKGATNAAALDQFVKDMQSMALGAHNSWRIPVIESETFEWINLQTSNVDMEFVKWQEYIVKTLCAVFKMDSVEIGFSTKDGKSLFNTSEFEKISHSYDKGLRPIMSTIEKCINKYLISPLNPEYEFRFVSKYADFDGGVKGGLQTDPNVKLTESSEAKIDEGAHTGDEDLTPNKIKPKKPAIPVKKPAKK
jgi:hypothetical protein